MKRLVAPFGFVFLVLAAHACATCSPAIAMDWLTVPSRYTHSPQTGERINQYAQVEAPPLTDQTARISSGYTHYRSTIQAGQSADNYNRVDQWGPPVRPYGEWEFPYRPYSAPYPAWGAPYAGLNLGPNFIGGGFPGGGGRPGGGHPGGGYPGGGYPGGGYPGGGYPGGGFQGGGFQGGPIPSPVAPGGGIPGQPFEPYPADPNGLYPVPPWYGGFQPNVSQTPTLSDREFFRSPQEHPVVPRP